MNKKRLVRTVSWPYPSAKYVLQTKKAKINEKNQKIQNKQQTSPPKLQTIAWVDLIPKNDNIIE